MTRGTPSGRPGEAPPQGMGPGRLAPATPVAKPSLPVLQWWRQPRAQRCAHQADGLRPRCEPSPLARGRAEPRSPPWPCVFGPEHFLECGKFTKRMQLEQGSD